MSKMKSVLGGVLLLALSSSPVFAGKADAGKWINIPAINFNKITAES